MLELVFVVVVIGILAAVILPSTKTNPVQDAAIQVLSHIRYTQHLAMVDDKFDTSDANWYKNRWQIFFAQPVASDNLWAYSIFSDSSGGSTGNPDISELAVNPLDRNKLLTGGYSAVPYATDARVTKEMNLGHKYSITSVDFSANCKDNSLRIAFDHMGRPLYDGPHLLDDAYHDGAVSRLVTSDCNITITDGSETAVITIKPETGYAYIND